MLARVAQEGEKGQMAAVKFGREAARGGPEPGERDTSAERGHRSAERAKAHWAQGELHSMKRLEAQKHGALQKPGGVQPWNVDERIFNGVWTLSISHRQTPLVAQDRQCG